jgi:uncharacterized protein (TIGR04222 family)
LPPIPSKPDPYEIAFLRGGAEDLTRLLVLDLLRRGYLHRVVEKKTFLRPEITRIAQAPDAPSEKTLTALERVAFSHFSTGYTTAQLFQQGGLTARIKEFCKPIEERLQEEELVSSPERRASVTRVSMSGIFLIVSLFVYKLAVAIAKGRSNVAFLIVLVIVGSIAMVATGQAPHLTRRGKGYLKALQDAYAGLKDRAVAESEKGPMANPSFLLVPALFGVGVLAGTPYTDIAELFKRSSTTGGCGGGGCGGGGCGGGGCGGGGCGGCGG